MAETTGDCEGRAVRFGQAKALVARVICHPLVGTLLGRLYHDRIPSRGCVINTSGAVAPMVKAYLFWGLYESAEIRFVERYLRPDLDVVEIGSSLGAVSCHIAKRIDGDRRLVCVEANSDLLGLLKENLDRNVGRASVTVVHGAVDYSPDRRTEVTLAVGDTNLTSIVSGNGVSAGRSIRVPSITLGTVLQQQSIGDYALVSDIEGAEAGILRHDAEALVRCRQMIIELHQSSFNDRMVSVQELADTIVRRHGFRLRAAHGPVYVFDK